MPSSFVARTGLASTSIALGRTEEILLAPWPLEERSPRKQEAQAHEHRVRGIVFLYRGDLASAREELEEFLKLEPASAAAAEARVLLRALPAP